jgi:glycerophosphoryl diester phosphodiesterase
MIKSIIKQGMLMLIFAHRGASGYLPENTLVAFEKALALGVDAIELDVHSVAGELVVFHDRRLEGKSDTTGLIHQQTLESLAKVRVQGEPIPTLWQVLSLIDGRCMVNIELKGMGCVAPFIELYPKALKALNFTPQQLLVSSFNHPYLAAVKQAFPDCPIAPLLAGIPLNLAQIGTDLKAFSINLDLGFINKALVEDAHKRGLKVFVYTVDNSDDILALRHLGVDGIFSNFPDIAMAALNTEVNADNASTGAANDKDYSQWFE